MGDKVLLSTQNLDVLHPGRSQKLDFKRAGPFKVTEVINLQVYWLDLEGQLGDIHPVFHVKLLEPFTAPEALEPPVQDEPPVQEKPADAHKGYEIEAILDCKARPAAQYRVSYKGRPLSDAKWIPADNLRNAKELIEEFYRRNPDARPNYKGKTTPKQRAKRPRKHNIERIYLRHLPG